MDLNHRPHAYQACALTELSYRPNQRRPVPDPSGVSDESEVGVMILADPVKG